MQLFDFNHSPDHINDYGAFLTLAPPQYSANYVESPAKSRRIRRGLEQKNKKSREVPRRWTDEEDTVLRNIVREIGGQWARIGRMMGDRSGKQCRERWNNHLRPDIQKNTPWSNEEEEIIVQIHKREGTKWAKICKMLHGRTENAIKNHWNSTRRKIVSNGFFIESSPLQCYIGIKCGSTPWKLRLHDHKDRVRKSAKGPMFSGVRVGKQLEEIQRKEPSPLTSLLD